MGSSNSVAYECAETGNAAYFETVELSVLSNSLDGDGKSLLLIAAARGRLNSVQVICRRCPELLDKRSPMGVTALHEAAFNGQRDVVKFLIYARGKMDHRQSYAERPEVVDSQLLMAVNVWKYTALHDAANRGHFESAKLLIDADVNKKLLGMVNIDNETAIDLAVKNKHHQIVKLLAQAEYSQDLSGHTAYEFAETAYFETVELSVLSNSLDCDGKTLLLNTAARGDLASVQVICRRCPELLDKRSPMGVTALHEAAYNGQHDVVKFLIYARGKMDHQQSFAERQEVVDSQLLMAMNVWEYTALHDAANRGHFQSAKLLIDADVNKKLLGMVNIDNETAMDLAVKNNHPQIVKLLAQAEYSQDRSGHTAHDTVGRWWTSTH